MDNDKRFVVLDCETTGLSHKGDYPDRVVEIGAIEVVNRKQTGAQFHYYVDPERDIPAAATRVHGLASEDLEGAPTFREIAAEFLNFVRGSTLVIHNAPFDMGFLDFELERINLEKLSDVCDVIDTLEMARKKYSGARNSLDALCKRYGIDNSHRELHGALLDSKILIDVFLAMTTDQSSLEFDQEQAIESTKQLLTSINRVPSDISGQLKTISATKNEIALHNKVLTNQSKRSGVTSAWELEV